MATPSSYAEVTIVPRIAVRFPIALPLPDGFDAEQPSTWPTITGRLEYVAGRLEYMPPCGEVQQRAVTDVLTELNLWRRSHTDFVVGGNVAGMLLEGEVRAADAAIWRAAPALDGFARTPPLLAVEVAGGDDTIELLREKARWYLDRGVATVWIIVPQARSAMIVTRAGEETAGERMPEPHGLSGLSPVVADFFRQLG